MALAFIPTENGIMDGLSNEMIHVTVRNSRRFLKSAFSKHKQKCFYFLFFVISCYNYLNSGWSALGTISNTKGIKISLKKNGFTKKVIKKFLAIKVEAKLFAWKLPIYLQLNV